MEVRKCTHDGHYAEEEDDVLCLFAEWAFATAAAALVATASTATTDPSSTAENSDQDADAEMEDDDSFAMVNPSPIKPQQPIQQQATLEVPRTRPVQQQQRNPQFMMPTGAGSPANRAAINMSRSMPNMNMAMQNGGMHGGDMAMAMQGVRGDAMFLE